ncbi:MAG: DNA polymerase III subunit gamma/tau [Elusimicrobiota bacterium]
MMSSEKSPKSYSALARRYRPGEFDDVSGQDAVSVTLKNSILAGRVAQAYLFTGPRGVGKTTTARILAKALNCAKGPTPNPCGECQSCQEIALSSSLDVLEMDAASHTGVDNIREIIIDTVALAPARDRRKIFIIDEAHMLSIAAFNALLKTLEEPPPHVVFILATTEAVKIPATIASRCQRFRFKPIATQAVVERLASVSKAEKIPVESGALDLIARISEGSLRDAVSLLDQCRSSSSDASLTEQSVREMFGLVPEEATASAARALFERDAKALRVGVEQMREQGFDPREVLRDLRAGIQEIYFHKMGAGSEPKPAWKGASAAAQAQSAAFWLRRVAAILESLRFDERPWLAVELGLYEGLEAAPDLSEWVKRLEALEKRLGQGLENEPIAPDSSSDLWVRTLSLIRRDKASLAAILEGASVGRDPDGNWNLKFEKLFEMEQAQKNQELIAKALSSLQGGPARVALSVGKKIGAARMDEVVDAELPAVPPPSSAGSDAAWKDVSSPDEEPCPPELKTAREILGGRLRIKKK